MDSRVGGPFGGARESGNRLREGAAGREVGEEGISGKDDRYHDARFSVSRKKERTRWLEKKIRVEVCEILWD